MSSDPVSSTAYNTSAPPRANLPVSKGQLLACPECDLMQRANLASWHGTLRCARCSAVLVRSKHDSIQHTLALLVAACILFVMANSAQLVTLDLQGSIHTCTLPGAVQALWQQKRELVALMVLVTAILVPGGLLGLMLYVLVPLWRGQVPPRIKLVMRLLHHMRPWGMIEVLLLGILVAVVKLSGHATVLPGPALWALAALLPVTAGMLTAWRPDDVWMRLGELKK